ncbi:MAG: PqqD family protein [Clostridia bacterium]|nr:PqqD family protein [Clostridia bacterium]
MKLKCKFVINTVAGENIAVPVGKDSAFKGYIKLNGTGKEIFEELKSDTDREKIIEKLREEYPEAAESEIAESVDDIIGRLTAAGLIV